MALLLTTENSNFDTATFKECINDVFPTVTWTVVPISTERFRTVTFSRNATLQWVVLWILSATAAWVQLRWIQVELQEFTGWSWVTRVTWSRPIEVSNTLPYWIYWIYIPFASTYAVNTTAWIWRIRIFNLWTWWVPNCLVSPTTSVPFSIFVTTDTLSFTNWDRVIAADWHEFTINKTATVTAPWSFEDANHWYTFILCNWANVRVPWGSNKKLTQNGSIFLWLGSWWHLWTQSNPLTTKWEFEREINKCTGSANTNWNMFKFTGSTTSSYHLWWEFNCQYVTEMTEKEFDLASDAAASQKTLILTQAPTTWVNWDHIRIDKNESLTQWDLTRHTIDTAVWATITTAANLTTKRIAWAKVCNFSRNPVWIYPTAWLTYVSNSVGWFSNLIIQWCRPYNVVFVEALVNATYISNSTIAFPNRKTDIIWNSLEKNTTAAYYFYAWFKPKNESKCLRNHTFRLNIYQTLNSIYVSSYKSWLLKIEDIISISPYVSEFYTTSVMTKVSIKNYRCCNMWATTVAWWIRAAFLESTADNLYFYWLGRPARWFVNNNWLKITNATYEYCSYQYLYEWTIIDVSDISPTIINNQVWNCVYLWTAYWSMLVTDPSAEMSAWATIYDAVKWTSLALVNNWWITNNDKFFTTTWYLSRCWSWLADPKTFWTDNFIIKSTPGVWEVSFWYSSPMWDKLWETIFISVYCWINSTNYWIWNYVMPKIKCVYDWWISTYEKTASQIAWSWQRIDFTIVPITSNPQIDILFTTETDTLWTDWEVYFAHIESNIPSIRNLDNRSKALPILDVWQLETNATLVADATMKSTLSFYTAPWSLVDWLRTMNDWIKKASRKINYNWTI